jgi:hypothetical protein
MDPEFWRTEAANTDISTEYFIPSVDQHGPQHALSDGKRGCMNVLRGLVFFLAVVPLTSSTTAQLAPPEKPLFTITISTPESVVKTGSDMRLKATMTNTSDRDIFYTVGTGPIIDIKIRDVEGKLVPETPDGRKIHGTDRREGPGPGTVIRVPIKPGKAFEGESILNQEYDLSNPGKYTIQAHRFDRVSKTMVKSNTITVTATP